MRRIVVHPFAAVGGDAHFALFNRNRAVNVHKLNAEISGSQTDVGESPNVAASVRISSAAGDVTGNYAIAVVDGTLIVTGKKLTVTTADGGYLIYGL